MTFWGHNSVHVIFLLKTAHRIPYGINPNGPLCCTDPLMIGSLASFAVLSLIYPRCSGYTSPFLPGSHGFILPCLCLYLEFLLVHPNPPHSPGELSFFRSTGSTSVTSSEKPLVTQWSKINHALFCEAIVLLLNSTKPRALICFLNPLFYCYFLEVEIGSYFCVNST